jgi:hypothetical protein
LLDQVAEGDERIAVNWHDSIVRGSDWKGNLSDFSVNAPFTHYPTAQEDSDGG